MNIKDIQQLIKFVAKSGVSEVKIESDELKIAIKTSPNNKQIVYSSPAPVPTITPTVEPAQKISEIDSPKSEPLQDNEDSEFLTIKSPIIGICYPHTTYKNSYSW